MPEMSALEGAFCRSAPWTQLTGRVILPWALQGRRPRGELLELGAGAGGMAAATASRLPDLQITVTDVDPAMVQTARQRLAGRSGLHVERADVTALPYDDRSFDYVTSYLMLHHVIEWRRALTEIARVLRPGGAVVGYDLTDTRLARWVHWADRSPHKLIPAAAFESALIHAGFGNVTIRRGLGGHVMRFVADKGVESTPRPTG